MTEPASSPSPADAREVVGRLDALADQVAALTAAVDAQATQLDVQAAQLVVLGVVGSQLAELAPKVRAVLDSRPARALAAWRQPAG